MITESSALIERIISNIVKRKVELLNISDEDHRSRLQQDLINLQQRLQNLESISNTHATREDETLNKLATALSDLMMHTNDYNQARN